MISLRELTRTVLGEQQKIHYTKTYKTYIYKNVIVELMEIMLDTQITDSRTSGSSKLSLMVKGREAVIKKKKRNWPVISHTCGKLI